MKINFSFIPCICSHPTSHLSQFVLSARTTDGKTSSQRIAFVDEIYLLLELIPNQFQKISYSLCPIAVISHYSSVISHTREDQFHLLHKPVQSVNDNLITSTFFEEAHSTENSCCIREKMIEMTKRQALHDSQMKSLPRLALIFNTYKNEFTMELLALYWRIYDTHCPE